MPTPFAGHYLDGRTAARQRATIQVMASGLQVGLESGATFWWAFEELRQTQGFYAGEQVRLERGGPLPELLLVDDPAFLSAMREAAQAPARRFHNPVRRRARVQLTVLAALAVIGIVAALYLWGIPAAAGVLATRVPVSWEERLGEAVVAHLAPPERSCLDPAREAAIGAILARLLASVPEARYKFRVIVLNDPTVNALAAPGGQIVLLRGLLERTRTAEELAGVLAHEVQHVLKRHATRALLQHASTGLLLVAVAGDVSGVMAYGLESARALGALRYSRQAEEEADAEGVRMLLAAGINPRGMIAFFESMRAAEREGPSLTGYLSSHPATEDRIATLKRLVAKQARQSVPLLPDRDWRDVVQLCAAR